MKKVKNVTIVLLSIIVTGCSNINSERQENNSIAIEQQTEGENQSIQSIDTAKENETPVVTDNIVDYSEYFQGISGCAVIYDESSSSYSFYSREKCETEVSPLSTFKIVSALAGLESNVIENETSTMEYSGVKYPISILSNVVHSSRKDDPDDAESIAAVYRDIYEEAVETNTLGSLETLRRIVARLGENGYVAVDSKNLVDMAGAEQAIEFCKAVEEKKNDKLTIIVIKDFGFRKFDLETENGNVIIVRGYYQYDKNGCLRNISTVKYPADIWQYTEEGYLLFEGSYFSTENYVLTLRDTPEHTALRVLPLDDKCRELNRKYILPVGYEQNNIFLTDWNEEDFGDLDFYDIFDSFYPILYKQSVPYVADENLEVGAVYRMPKEIFENVIMTHFNIDREMLRSKTTYFSEDATYEYRPRGFYEVEYPDIPYPEVVDYTENQDGTITLIINAVYPNSNTSAAYSHKTVIRPINEDCFQYVSNQMISLEDERDIWWHSNRLTMEEWLEIYGSAE